MKNKIILAFGIILLAILLSGCTKIQEMTGNVEIPFIGSPENPLETPIAACVQLCRAKMNEGVDLSSGPCLSNEIVTNWVCDVAHDPRITAIDSKPENQCPAYNNGTAKHFVEVSANCDLIRTH